MTAFRFAVYRIFKFSIVFVCPLFFSIYPILFLYTYNGEMLNLYQMTFPLCLAVLLTVLLFGLWRIILKENLKASLATIGFVILFWNYDLFFRGITFFLNLKHWHVLPLLIFLYGHFIYFIFILSKKIELKSVNKVLFVMVSFLILFNLFVLIPKELQKQKQTFRNIDKTLSYNTFDATSNPDIYLIIFDEYASLNTVKQEWGYNNDDFVCFLKEKNFFVAENSSHRYVDTLWNMSSLLNLDYVSGPVEKNDMIAYIFDRDTTKGTKIYNELNKINSSDLINAMNENFLVNYLKDKGYTIIVLEGLSYFYPSFKIDKADLGFSYKHLDNVHFYNIFFKDAFGAELIKRSMILPFELFFLNTTGDIHYDGTKYILNYLTTDVYDVKGPKFVYAHITCPHSPYVFDREGNYSKAIGIGNENSYLEQYIFITKEAKKIITEIQKRYDNDPIIIMLSDHGPRHNHININDPLHAFKAFNAIYFPNKDYHNLHDSIAPVNVLRIMLNQYFKEHFEMLEDH